MIKQLKAILICACLVSALALSACSDKSSLGSFSPVGTSAAEIDSGGLVVIQKAQAYRYDDENGGYTVSFRIPKIVLNSADADRVNDEITQKYAETFETAESETNKGSELSCVSLDYEYYVYENILSVLIKRAYFSHNVDYSVYSFDIKTGGELDNSTLAERLGIKSADAQAALKEALQKDYNSKYTDNSSKDNSEFAEKTFSQENLDSSVYYVDKNGSLTALCTEYTSEGSGEYDVLLVLNYSQEAQTTQSATDSAEEKTTASKTDEQKSSSSSKADSKTSETKK